MLDRIVAVGGTLQVGRSPSGGTRVDGRIPLATSGTPGEPVSPGVEETAAPTGSGTGSAG
jgi:hypothetical protein